MTKIRRVRNTLGFALFVATATICAVIHVATFVTILPPIWILAAVPTLAGAALCAGRTEPKFRFKMPSGKLALVGCGLLVYAIFTFAYFYKTTGGASSVGMVDGQYVSEYKTRVIRTISEYEYRFFPDLWTRVMSAWIAMMAVFGVSNLAADGDRSV